MIQNQSFNRSVNKNQQAAMEQQLKMLVDRLEERKKEGERIAREHGSMGPKLRPDARTGPESKAFQPLFAAVTEEQFAQLSNEALRSDLDYLDALKRLEAISRVRERNRAQLDAQLDARITAEFQKDAKVIALTTELATAEKQIQQSKDSARTVGDPALRAVLKNCEKLRLELEDLRKSEYDRIRQRLAATDHGALSDATIHELEVAVEKARSKRYALADYLAQIAVRRAGSNLADNFNFKLIDHEIESLFSKMDRVTKNLEQLNFEAAQENFRVMLLDAAAVPKTPTNNHRARYMPLASMGILIGLLAFMLAQEVKLGRKEKPPVRD
jgi:hypothetical protein